MTPTVEQVVIGKDELDRILADHRRMRAALKKVEEYWTAGGRSIGMAVGIAQSALQHTREA